MTARRVGAMIPAIMTVAVMLSGAQSDQRPRRWAIYEREMQNPVADPPDAYEETEFAVGRLRFRSPRDRYRRRGSRWGTDANKGDRLFSQILRRLTRVHVRSVEQIVDIDSDEIYNWPWLFAVAVGDWQLSDSQVLRLRNFFDRGGSLMVDDFHGPREWRDFVNDIARILPNSSIVELKDDDPIFHTVYDLSERVQVSGFNIVYGTAYERMTDQTEFLYHGE